MTENTQEFEIDFLATDEAPLEELQRIDSLPPPSGPLTMTAYRNLLPKASASTPERGFGGWQHAFEMAGLGHRYNGTKAKMKSNDDLLDKLRRVHRLRETDWLTRNVFNTHSITSAGILTKGSELAGIAIHPTGTQPPSEKECFENLAEVWTHYDRAAQFPEIFHHPSPSKERSYEARWKTWQRALVAFASWVIEDDPASDIQPLAVEETRHVGLSITKQSEEDRRETRPAVRCKVFKLGCLRCVASGRSPATHLNIELPLTTSSPLQAAARPSSRIFKRSARTAIWERARPSRPRTNPMTPRPSFSLLLLPLLLIGCKSTPATVPTTTATTYPTRPTYPPPPFKIFHHANSTFTLTVATDTTDDQVSALLWQLRDAARSHSFDTIKIPQKQVDADGSTIWFHIYRGPKCAPEKYASGPPPCGASYHAAGDYTLAPTARPTWDKGQLNHGEAQTDLWNPDAPYAAR